MSKGVLAGLPVDVAELPPSSKVFADSIDLLAVFIVNHHVEQVIVAGKCVIVAGNDEVQLVVSAVIAAAKVVVREVTERVHRVQSAVLKFNGNLHLRHLFVIAVINGYHITVVRSSNEIPVRVPFVCHVRLLIVGDNVIWLAADIIKVEIRPVAVHQVVIRNVKRMVKHGNVRTPRSRRVNVRLDCSCSAGGLFVYYYITLECAVVLGVAVIESVAAGIRRNLGAISKRIDIYVAYLLVVVAYLVEVNRKFVRRSVKVEELVGDSAEHLHVIDLSIRRDVDRYRANQLVVVVVNLDYRLPDVRPAFNRVLLLEQPFRAVRP